MYANATILGGADGDRGPVGDRVERVADPIVAPDTVVVLEKPALRLKGGSKAATEAFMYHI